MRVIFAGTPAFAARALDAIVGAGFDVALVLTQPDRPAGRGHKLTASPVKALALERGLGVYQPERLRTPEQQAPMLAVPADIMVVAAYGLILPQRVLDHPAHGCLNIHASLLPRWRGAAPIHRAILAGDRETGVCIMQMDAGLDTGAVVSTHPVAIDDHDTTGALHDKLAAIGADAIVTALRTLERDGKLDPTPQPASGETYAAKITAEEARIDWSQDALRIARSVRAFNPAPGAFTTLGGAVLKIWSASPASPSMGAPKRQAPGELAFVDGALAVGTGTGALVIDEIQPAGARRMRAGDWARGRLDVEGLILGT